MNYSKLLTAFLSQLTLILSFIVSFILARNLTLNVYGEYSILKNILALSILVVNYSFDRTALDYLKNNKIFKKKYIYTTKLVLFFCLLFPFYLIGFFFDIDNITNLVLSAIIFINIFDIKYLFDIKKRIGLDILLQILKPFPTLLYVIYCYIFNINISLNYFFLFLFIGNTITYLFQHLYFKIFPIFSFNIVEIKGVVSNYFPAFIGVLISFANNFSDMFIILFYKDPEELAIYTVAYTMYVGLLVFFGTLSRFYISATLGKELKLEIVNNFSKKMFILSFIFFLPLFIFAKEIIVLILGNKYESSVIIFRILLFSFIVVSSSLVYGNLLLIKGLNKEYMKAMLIATISNVILNLMFVPLYGIKSAAVVTIFSAIISFISTYKYLKK